MARSQTLQELRNRVAPVSLAREQALPVPDVLTPLFPLGGLQRGHSVGVQGPGGWSLALALTAAITTDDGWTAIVGGEELGLLAATESGLRLDRLLLVESMAATELAASLAVLVDVVDVLLVHPRRPLDHRSARRLEARGRERGAVIVHLDGGRGWPLPLDVTITASEPRWSGLERGHGLLRHRRLTLEAVGRRSAARPRRLSVLLPGPGGGLAPDIDELQPPALDPSTRAPLARVS